MEEKKLTDEKDMLSIITDWLSTKAKTDDDMYYVGVIAGTFLAVERQKAEIERLKKRHGVALLRNDDLDLENYELKKQVDELKEERENMQAEIIATEEARLQAVKDTAKEILDELDLYFKGTTFRKGYEFKKIEKKLKEIAERKGVEVE